MANAEITTEPVANGFPPIAEYGFLSDCENNCLVAPNGAVEWLSLPRPDSPSVFGALLDRTAGLFRFGPTSTQVPHQRRYLPGTMVLETTWHTPTGWLISRTSWWSARSRATTPGGIPARRRGTRPRPAPFCAWPAVSRSGGSDDQRRSVFEYGAAGRNLGLDGEATAG